LHWVSFAQSNPDGLGNIWLVFYTFPIVIIGMFILHLQFPYVYGGYYEAHTLYFWLSVAFLALVLFFVFHGLQQFFCSRPSHESNEPNESN